MEKSIDILDQKFFSIKQLGLVLAACVVFTVTWTWRAAITHYDFELLKQKTELNEINRKREDALMREIHTLDNIRTNERLDKKTGRIEDKIKTKE